MGQSMLYRLTTTEEGIKILVQFFQEQPSLGQDITAEVLCQNKLVLNKEYDYDSPLSGLAASDAGVGILYLFISTNESLRMGITADALCLCFKSIGELSALLQLALDHEKHAILLKLLVNNEPLLIAMRVHAPLLASELCDCDLLEDGDSGLFSLSLTEFGHQILLLLIENNESLQKQISGQAIFEDVRNDGTSALYNLILSNLGCNILCYLLKSNSSIFITDAAIAAFCRRSLSSGLSPMDMLVRQPYAHPMLLALVDARPPMLHVIANMSSSVESTFSVLECFQCTPEGEELLRRLRNLNHPPQRAGSNITNVSLFSNRRTPEKGPDGGEDQQEKRPRIN